MIIEKNTSHFQLARLLLKLAPKNNKLINIPQILFPSQSQNNFLFALTNTLIFVYQVLISKPVLEGTAGCNLFIDSYG